MNNKKIIEFIKNELAYVSIFEFLSSNYEDEIVSKLMKEYHLNSKQELRNIIIENGPDLYGFSSYERKGKERKLQTLNKGFGLSRKDELLVEIDSISSELDIFPTEELIIKNEKKKKETEFICKFLFKERLGLPIKKTFNNLEDKKRNYKFSECYLNTNNLNDVKFNNYRNGDIKKWREELLILFNNKLPVVTPTGAIKLIETALLSIKNGLLFGQAIITNDNTICLNISDGIMVKLYFHKKILACNELKIHYDLVAGQNNQEILSTGGYSTIIDLPENIIIHTRNNVVQVCFETSPLLNGLTQFKSNSIVPEIERIEMEKALEE